MALFEIKGKRSMEVISELIGPLTELANDPDCVGLLSRENKPDGMTNQQFFLYRVAKYTPALMKNHESAMLAILSTIKGIPPEEYAENLTPDGLLTDVLELASDSTVANLFILAQSTISSGSVQENTEGQKA